MILKWGKIFLQTEKRFFLILNLKNMVKSVHTMIRYSTIVLIEKMEE